MKNFLILVFVLTIVSCSKDEPTDYPETPIIEVCDSFFGSFEQNEWATTYNSVELNWYSNANRNNWEVEYGLEGFALGTGTIIVRQYEESHIVISALASDTDYDFYLRRHCDNNLYSDWIGPLSIQTLEQPYNLNCLDPTNFEIVSIGMETIYYGGSSWPREFARLYWSTNGETSWEVEYGNSGFSLGNGFSFYTSDNSIKISGGGLDNGVPSDFYVRAYCGADGTSDWIGPLVGTP